MFCSSEYYRFNPPRQWFKDHIYWKRRDVWRASEIPIVAVQYLGSSIHEGKASATATCLLTVLLSPLGNKIHQLPSEPSESLLEKRSKAENSSRGVSHVTMTLGRKHAEDRTELTTH